MNFLELFDQGDNDQTFAAGDIVIPEGEPITEMLVILEGKASILVGGDEMFSAEPGDIVGEMSLIDHSPACATVKAVTNIVAAPVDERRFLFLVQEHPTFALGVMKVVADRLRAMNARSVASAS